MNEFVSHWALGLSNAPYCFQHFMETCLGDLRDKICILFLDDIIVFSGTFQDYIEHLWKVLTRLQEHAVKLKPKKCNLFKQEVTFLEKTVYADGYKLDPVSTELVPKPQEHNTPNSWRCQNVSWTP